MNADPEVREDIERGWGGWAVEVRETGRFIGIAGLDPAAEDLAFTGVETGRQLARGAWGHGYATEAACDGVILDFDDPAGPDGPPGTLSSVAPQQWRIQMLGS